MGQGHTPGPWFVMESGSCKGMSDIRGEGKVLVSGMWTDTEEFAANARLLAAAPDLFDGACDFIAYEEAADRGDDLAMLSLFNSASQKLRAAVAKAKGGASS